MSALPESGNDALAYLLTNYPVDSPPALLEDVIRGFLRRKLNDVAADEAVIKFLPAIRDYLVTEYNERYKGDGTLRFHILDDSGDKIQGIGNQGQTERLMFQDCLNELEHSEFEGLAAVILQVAGCNEVWKTPESHDQGIDAFGYSPLLKRTRGKWLGAPPQVTFLAQAKHYSECRVGSKDVREFVGSYNLALHQIYSDIDKRYKQLAMLPFAPVSLIFITSEEIPGTVKRLSLRSGVNIFTSDDLFDLLLAHFSPIPAQVSKKWLLQKIRSAINAIPIAR